ncbi:MAG TPA: hypothetical protein PKW82_10570 [Spirochaetales bacterium]|nr:hypothetical protein [Spirochaetales bacterium]
MTMRNAGLPALALVFALAATGAHSQAPSVSDFEREFVATDLEGKVEVLRSSADLGPRAAALHLRALAFVADNLALLGPERHLAELAIEAARGASAAGSGDAAPLLLGLFAAFDDSGVGIALLEALGTLGRGYPDASAAIEAWLAAKAEALDSAEAPELRDSGERSRLLACAAALGSLGAPSAYGELFDLFARGSAAGDEGIRSAAAGAMASLAGDYRGFLSGFVASGPAARRAAALSAGLDYAGLPDEDRGMLAEKALAGALDEPGADPVGREIIRAIRFRAARELRVRRWQRASPLAARHFYDILDGWNKGRSPETELIEAIDTLGAMGTNEAAQTLAIFLQFANSEIERGASFDEDVALAVIRNLGQLGDKMAFDYLLYMGYLPWSETVKRAARDALLLLRW